MKSHDSLSWVSIRRLLPILAALVVELSPRPTMAKGAITPDLRSTRPRPQTAWQAEGFDPKRSLGIFVGVRTFHKDDSVEIPYAADDAIDLAHLFALELGLVSPERVWLVLSGEAQKEATRRRLASLEKAGAKTVPATRSDLFVILYKETREAGPEGLLVVTFATHGFTHRGTPYLMAQDSLEWRAEDTSFSYSYLLEAVTVSKATRKLVLLDACRERLIATRQNGAPDPRTAVSEALADAIAGVQGFVVLSAARRGGYAFDDRRRRNGVFSGAVLDALRCGALADSRGFITVGSLADYVDSRVVAWTEKHRPDLKAGIEINDESAVSSLPLTVCGVGQNDPTAAVDAAVEQIELCSAEGARLMTCGSKILTIKIDDFWNHGAAVSFDVLSSPLPGIDTGALIEGGYRDLALSEGRCVLAVLRIDEPCVTFTLNYDQQEQKK